MMPCVGCTHENVCQLDKNKCARYIDIVNQEQFKQDAAKLSSHLNSIGEATFKKKKKEPDPFHITRAERKADHDSYHEARGEW